MTVANRIRRTVALALDGFEPRVGVKLCLLWLDLMLAVNVALALDRLLGLG